MSPPDVFSLPIFLVTFRESLETVIIVSVLLAFLKQTVFPQDRTLYKKLVRQVWLGTGAGFLLTLLISAILIGVFYTTGASSWDGSELKYEGAFSLVAAVIISVVGAALLRVGRMREKWAGKLAKSINDYNKDGGGGGGNGGKGAMMMMWRRVKSWTERYFMLVLPFVTVLREGIEAIVFIAGVTFSAPATAVPLAAVVGLAVGAIVGWVLYKGGSSTKLQVFLVISTCLLYLVGAGLFSRAVWSFEQQAWQDIIGGDVTETGDGPGSYDIDKSVWHVNCCNPNMNGGGGWGVLNAIFGWTNSATYGSVISYNLYWLFVIVAFVLMRYREVHGRWPLTKAKGSRRQEDHEAGNRASGEDKASVGKMVATEGIAPVEV